MPPTFLLRDDFTTAAAAPLTSPRTAEPGPGTLTLVQTDGQFSISAGKLVIPAQATPVWGDQYLRGNSMVRVAGRTAIWQHNFAALPVTGTGMGWYRTSAPVDSNVEHGARVQSGFGWRLMSNALGFQISIGNVATATDYYYAVALQNTGALHLVRGGAYTNWTLLWTENALTGTNLYPGMSNYNGDGTLDSFRVLDLPSPFNVDTGLATSNLAGARTALDAFSHEANCLIEFTDTTIPSASNLDFRFRRQDATNYWQVTINSTGALTLNEVVAGTPTQRATAAAVVSSGHRCVIVADSTTIRGYSNNTLRWTYSSASNFATATAGELNALGAGGAVSDIITWPRVITGAPATILDAAVGGSGDLTATLAAATLTATGQGLTGQLTQTLAAATLVSTGQVRIAGQLTVTLADATTVASAKLAITAQMTAQLGAALLASAGRLSIRGQLSLALGAATLYASNHPIAIELGTVYGQGGSGFVFGQLDYGEVIGL